MTTTQTITGLSFQSKGPIVAGSILLRHWHC